MEIVLRRAEGERKAVVHRTDDRLVEPAFQAHLLTHLRAETDEAGRTLWYWIPRVVNCKTCGAGRTPSFAILGVVATMDITVQP